MAAGAFFFLGEKLMSDDEMVAAFERGEAPGGSFHHADHVRVAWCYLRRYDLPHAIARFADALKHFARAQGKADLYHETITVAFLLIVAGRLGETPDDVSWAEFAARHADLLTWKPSVLDRYYTSDRLWSTRARRGFVMPDRVPQCPD